jgi:hypothetical protein
MQRRVEAHDSLDDFPTPPWATRAAIEAIKGHFPGLLTPDMMCREPCANRGFMVRPLREYFETVIASDVHDYGVGFPVDDYLFGPLQTKVDWTFINPPFRLAEQFIQRAISTSRFGVAVIVRSAFVEGIARYESLFRAKRPTLILQHCERVPMVKGRYDPKATTATAYTWLIWVNAGGAEGTRFDWIPKCRARLERPEDGRLEEVA